MVSGERRSLLNERHCMCHKVCRALSPSLARTTSWYVHTYPGANEIVHSNRSGMHFANIPRGVDCLAPSSVSSPAASLLFYSCGILLSILSVFMTLFPPQLNLRGVPKLAS